MPQKADAAVGRDNWTAVDGSETLCSGVLACGATAIGWGAACACACKCSMTTWALRVRKQVLCSIRIAIDRSRSIHSTGTSAGTWAAWKGLTYSNTIIQSTVHCTLKRPQALYSKVKMTCMTDTRENWDDAEMFVATRVAVAPLPVSHSPCRMSLFSATMPRVIRRAAARFFAQAVGPSRRALLRPRLPCATQTIGTIIV